MIYIRVRVRLRQEKVLQGKILTPTKRISRTPFSSKIEDQVKGVTVYNHMILPTIFKDAEEDCRHLKSEVQVWDVSVQRQVEIVGKDAATLLELLTPRNVKDMNPNKCLYAPMVNQNGGMINDPVLLRVDEDRYWISIADSDVLLWVSGIAAALKLNVEVSEPSVAPLAIQGPKSRLLMKRIFGNEMDYFSYFDLRKLKFGKHTINVARTGWSKQGGFEIYVEGTEYANELWEELFTNGKDLNVRPGCPNQIERIESGLLSYGSDMTVQNSPFECGLGRFCEIDANSTCIGSEALENIASNGPSKVLRYFDVKGDNVPFCHDHWPIINNKKVGEITSGIFSTEFNTNVAIGIVDVEYAIEGTKLQVLIDNKLRDAFVKERPFNPKLKPFI